MLGFGKKKAEDVSKAVESSDVSSEKLPEFNKNSGNSSVLLTLEGKDGKISVMEDVVRINKYKQKIGLTGKWDSSKITKTYEIPRNTITQVKVVDVLNTHQLNIYFPNAGFGGSVIILINKEQKAQAEEINKLLGLLSLGNIDKILQKRGISPNDVLIATEGSNGQIILTGSGVLIGREGGLMTKMVVGFTKGDKLLPYRSITGIQFKEPGITVGYIQFTLLGGIESRGGAFDAVSDENTVTFNADKLDIFRKIRDMVEERQGLGTTQIPSMPTPQSPISSIADELGKLSALKRDGAITEEEFEQLKKDLLGKH